MGEQLTWPTEEIDLPTDDIDPRHAQGVRAATDEEAVVEYAGVYRNDPNGMPRVDVFAGGGKNFLADGGHRLKARELAGLPTIPCLVRRCFDEAEADRLAAAFAGSANDRNPIRRTNADKWATIRHLIVRPEYADASDNELGRTCSVDHKTVGRTRLQMTAADQLTGRARADDPGRFYKENATYRSGTTRTKGGDCVPNPTQPSGDFPRPILPDTPKPTIPHHVGGNDHGPPSGVEVTDDAFADSPGDAPATRQSSEVDPPAPQTEGEAAHPFEGLMADVTRLTKEVTRQMNAGTPSAGRLLKCLSVAGLVEHRPGRCEGGVNIPAEMGFLPLRGVRAMIDLAGQPGKGPSDREIRDRYDKASGGFVPPLTVRRRKQKAERQKSKGGGA